MPDDDDRFEHLTAAVLDALSALEARLDERCDRIEAVLIQLDGGF